VEQDYAQAVTCYQKAAGEGLDAAQFNLGLKCENGEGVAQDSSEAAKWYRQAADQGFASAQFNLALKYVTGQGVEQDYVQAYLWMDLAAAGWRADDGKRYAATRDKLAATMNHVQIIEAQRLAREWISRQPGIIWRLIESMRMRD